MVSELDITSLIINVNKKEHIIVSVKGSDSEFVINLLAQEYGKAPEPHEVLPQTKIPSQLLDTGKVGFGFFADIGLSDPDIDPLLPLYRIREQLDMEGMPLRKIAKNLVFVDYLPVDIQIVDVDYGSEQIGAEFAQTFLDRFTSWVTDDHERLLIFGANRRMIENALEKTRHEEDIYTIERLGKFEYSLRCKRSTRASGILAAIGPRLRGVPMHLFIPNEIQAAKSDAKA